MPEEKQKVLIVDDLMTNCQILEKILQSPDVETVIVLSGESAIDTLKSEPNFDLILMDVRMPGLNGFETTKQIKALPKLKDIPVIFITAIYNSREWAEEGFSIGAYDYIIKPFDINILRKKVSLYLSLEKNKKQLMRQSDELLRLNRSLKILNDCNATALYAESISNVLSSFTNILAEDGNYPFVWITEYIFNKEKADWELVSSAYEAIDEFKDLLTEEINELIATENKFLSFYNFLEPNYYKLGLKEELKQKLSISDEYTYISLPFETSISHKFYMNILGRNLEVFNPDEVELIRNVAQNLYLLTEIKQSEQALKQREEQYRKFIETMNEGVVVVNKFDNIVLVNKEFCKLSGFEENELLNHKCSMIFEGSGEDYKDLKKQLLQNNSLSHETRLLRKDKTFVNTLVSMQIIPEPNMKNDVQLCIFTNITALKEAEESKLETQKLIQKTGLMSSIGVLSGSITHEISQPLNVIKIGTKGIMLWNKNNNSLLPDPIYEMLMSVSDATDKIEEIIKYMRSFWIDPSNRKYEILNLNDLIKKYLSINYQIFAKSLISTEIILDENDCKIYASKIEIEIILANLFSNSVNSLNEKGDNLDKKIIVKTKADEDSVLFIIEDNGIGLPCVSESELFSPFFSTHKDTFGTGLGLAIVEMFVKNQGAEIKAANRDEGGAIFTIRFEKSDR